MAQNRNSQSQNEETASQTGGSETPEEAATKEEKNPQISNPRWEDAGGQTIRIAEKDADGNDDDVTTLNAVVKDGKIKCKWKVIYTEDDDDSNSQQEKSEKGYTLSEYAFTVEYSITQ